MTTTPHLRTLDIGTSLSWTRRERRTRRPITSADRERIRLQYENRKRMRDTEYRIAYQQFWARR